MVKYRVMLNISASINKSVSTKNTVYLITLVPLSKKSVRGIVIRLDLRISISLLGVQCYLQQNKDPFAISISYAVFSTDVPTQLLTFCNLKQVVIIFAF